MFDDGRDVSLFEVRGGLGDRRGASARVGRCEKGAKEEKRRRGDGRWVRGDEQQALTWIVVFTPSAGSTMMTSVPALTAMKPESDLRRIALLSLGRACSRIESWRWVETATRLPAEDMHQAAQEMWGGGS